MYISDKQLGITLVINNIMKEINIFAYYDKHTFIIFDTSNDGGGYNYDIYEGAYDCEDDIYELEIESVDGGQCTGTIYNAIEMAIDQIETLNK